MKLTPEPPLDQQVLGKRPPMDMGSQFGVLMGLFGGGFILSQVIVYVLLLLAGGAKVLMDPGTLADAGSESVIPALKLGQFISAIVTFLVPAFVFTKIIREKTFSFLQLNKGISFTNFLLIPLIIVAAAPFIAYTAELNKLIPLPKILVEMENQAETITKFFLKSEGVGDLIINLIVVAVAAAVTEEVFFRGSVQTVLRKWLGNIHIAIWLSAVLFSFLHFQFQGFIPRMILGAVMGYLFFWTGSLWAPILAHFVNNGLGVVVNYLVQKGNVSPEIETFGSAGTDWVGILTGTALMMLFLFLVKRGSEKISSSA